MIRYLLSGTVALILAAPPADWDRRAADMLRDREDDLVRIEAGEFQSGDAELIRFLALYGRHKAIVEPSLRSHAPAGPRAPDSLLEAAKKAEKALLTHLRTLQADIDRLAKGAPFRPVDTALVRRMALYTQMRMEIITPRLEIGGR